jgi:hypothetical protein
MAMTQADFLALVDRLFPAHYLDPLREPGPGYEIIQQAASVGARVAAAVESLDLGNYILTAVGASRATAHVTFSRPTAAAGAFTLKAGTKVRASVSGLRFVLQEDVAFGAADLTGTPAQAHVQAEGAGEAWNLTGPKTTAAGDNLPGEIDTVAVMLTDPVFADMTLVVAQYDDATGGKFPMLDALGGDRGLPRHAGEGDAAYRVRLRMLPDTLTVDAITAVMTSVLAPQGIVGTLLELFEPTVQSCWGGPAATTGEYDVDLFVWGDPRDTVGLTNRWLDSSTFRGAFALVVPGLYPIAERGGVWNDTVAVDLGSLGSPNGTGYRSMTAWNMPDDTAPTHPAAWCWSGSDTGAEAVYAGLWDIVRAIKAGGVLAVLWLDGQ